MATLAWQWKRLARVQDSLALGVRYGSCKNMIYIYIYSTGKKHIFIILPNISMLDELTKDASVNIQNLPFFGGSGEFGR